MSYSFRPYPLPPRQGVSQPLDRHRQAPLFHLNCTRKTAPKAHGQHAAYHKPTLPSLASAFSNRKLRPSLLIGPLPPKDPQKANSK
jgi:hypothetical protein